MPQFLKVGLFFLFLTLNQHAVSHGHEHGLDAAHDNNCELCLIALHMPATAVNMAGFKAVSPAFTEILFVGQPENGAIFLFYTISLLRGPPLSLSV
jgi:hypothetical protein